MAMAFGMRIKFKASKLELKYLLLLIANSRLVYQQQYNLSSPLSVPFAGRLLKTEFPMARLVLVLAFLPSTPPFARLLQPAVSVSAEGATPCCPLGFRTPIQLLAGRAISVNS